MEVYSLFTQVFLSNSFFTLFTGFLLLSVDSFAQADRPISGTVLDSAHNEPLAGVSVQIKGTRQGTSTDSKGRFTLDIPSEHVTLDISFVGYKPIQITAHKGKPVTVLLPLAEDTTADVVVVAYGKQKKQSMVASITTINPKELRGATSNLLPSWAVIMSRARQIQHPRRCRDESGNILFWVTFAVSLRMSVRSMFAAIGERSGME